MPTPIKTVYERGGADYCQAIIYDQVLLAELSAVFTRYKLIIIAADGSFSTNKSVNFTLFLQTTNNEQPTKETVVSCLASLGLQPYDYVLVEAMLVIGESTNSVQLPCLELIFQGDESMSLAREKLPLIVAVEKQMQHIVANASGLLTKVRVMATDAIRAMGLFSAKSETTDSNQADELQQDSTTIIWHYC